MLSVVYRTVRILYYQSQVAALFLVSLFDHDRRQP
jgi:hypothetical protein